MIIKSLKLRNWKNFRSLDIKLTERMFIVGANASGKSNLLDAFRFLRDLVKPVNGGLQSAVTARGGMKKLRCVNACSRSVSLVNLYPSFFSSSLGIMLVEGV